MLQITLLTFCGYFQHNNELKFDIHVASTLFLFQAYQITC
jgi:hypothetical protein